MQSLSTAASEYVKLMQDAQHVAQARGEVEATLCKAMGLLAEFRAKAFAFAGKLAAIGMQATVTQQTLWHAEVLPAFVDMNLALDKYSSFHTGLVGKAPCGHAVLIAGELCGPSWTNMEELHAAAAEFGQTAEKCVVREVVSHGRLFCAHTPTHSRRLAALSKGPSV